MDKSKRKITIIVEDIENNLKTSSEISLKEIDDLYKKTGINGIAYLLTELNKQMDEKIIESNNII